MQKYRLPNTEFLFTDEFNIILVKRLFKKKTYVLAKQLRFIFVMLLQVLHEHAKRKHIYSHQQQDHEDDSG